MQIKTGDLVRVLYIGEGGTTLSAPTPVLSVRVEGGRAKRITVHLPDAPAADENGNYEVSAHRDFVSKYDTAARISEAADDGSHAGLGHLRNMEGYPAALDSADAAQARFVRLLNIAPTNEHDALRDTYAASYERVMGVAPAPTCQSHSVAGTRGVSA